MSHMPGDLFNLYLHQNYIDFFVEVDDLVRASEFLSFADVLGGDWNVRSFNVNIFCVFSVSSGKKLSFISITCML